MINKSNKQFLRKVILFEKYATQTYKLPDPTLEPNKNFYMQIIFLIHLSVAYEYFSSIDKLYFFILLLFLLKVKSTKFYRNNSFVTSNSD